MKRFLPIVIAALAFAPAAHASCNVSRFSLPGINAVYDPFDNSFPPVSQHLSVSTSGDCRGGRVEIALAPTPTSPETGASVVLMNHGHRLMATLRGAAGQQMEVSQPAAAFNNTRIALPLGSSEVLGNPQISLNIAAGQDLPPGRYTALISVLSRVTDAKGQQTTSSTPLSLSVYVKPSVRLAAGNGNLHIRVGELFPGRFGGPVYFDAYANLDYELLFKSDNDFRLVRDGHPSRYGVPYLPIVSDRPVVIGARGHSGMRVMYFSNPGETGHRHHSFDVKILPFHGLPAGNYSDLVTLEIRAKV